MLEARCQRKARGRTDTKRHAPSVAATARFSVANGSHPNSVSGLPAVLFYPGVLAGWLELSSFTLIRKLAVTLNGRSPANLLQYKYSLVLCRAQLMRQYVCLSTGCPEETNIEDNARGNSYERIAIPFIYENLYTTAAADSPTPRPPSISTPSHPCLPTRASPTERSPRPWLFRSRC